MHIQKACAVKTGMLGKGPRLPVKGNARSSCEVYTTRSQGKSHAGAVVFDRQGCWNIRCQSVGFVLL